MSESRIIPEEWEKVRRSQCLPGGCPRVTGSPPGPPKDRHCEICASEFLNNYWENLLHGPDGARHERERRPPRLTERGRHGASPLILLPGQRSTPLLWPVEARWRRRRAAVGWRPVLYGLGFAAMIAGAVLAGLTAWTIPGTLVLIAGIICLVATAAAQA